jgi:hypothetical protein
MEDRLRNEDVGVERLGEAAPYVEFESGEAHTAARCRNTLFRECEESRQTLRAIEQLIEMWQAKMHPGPDAMNDIRDMIAVDKELKQSLLSIGELAHNALKEEP